MPKSTLLCGGKPDGSPKTSANSQATGISSKAGLVPHGIAPKILTTLTDKSCSSHYTNDCTSLPHIPSSEDLNMACICSYRHCPLADVQNCSVSIHPIHTQITSSCTK